jgi:hypothetical protein
MTEEQAIERIDEALRKVLPDCVWTHRIARVAWDEIKAIVREDALTLRLPPADEAQGMSIKARNNDGKQLTVT